MLRPLLAASCLLGAAQARADGYYYTESVGFSTARGRDAAPLEASLHTRAGLGYRLGALSLEPWVEADLTFDRQGSTLELFGGAPAMGRADLDDFGLDARYSEPIADGFQAYVRAGPRYATAAGALNGYSGFGFGTGTGVALVGRVRVLGFLFAPLFFTSTGPKALAALFVDEGVDVFALHGPAMQTLSTPVIATSLGFAVGTDF
ncbi:MAG: outer membrane beta-barrel protein [Acidobacteriota bacterium]